MSLKALRVGDVVEWILKNRKNSAFKDYSWDKLTIQISNAITEGLFYYTTNGKGDLVGVVCCRQIDNKTINVDDILFTERNQLKTAMKYFNSRFKGYTITGHCRGRFRKFNDTKKLERRVM